MIPLLQEAKHTLREMPWVVTSVVLAVVFGVGVQGAFYYEADAPEVKVIANRHAHGVNMVRAVDRDPCEAKIPGFTVVVGLKEYSVELTVPVAKMRSVLEDAQMKLSSTWNRCNRSVA